MGLTPVLVVADSNVAVDNIGAILAADGVGIVRCGPALALTPPLTFHPNPGPDPNPDPNPNPNPKPNPIPDH